MSLNDASLSEYWSGELNPKFWKDEKLLEEVESRLMAIALDFYNGLDTEHPLVDVCLMGSNAAFAWNEASDLDLHLFIELPETGKEDILRWMDAERCIWNLKHDVSIKGHFVEVYIQEAGTEAISQGVYSLVTHAWINKPSRGIPKINLSDVEKRVDRISREICFLEKQLAAEGGVDPMQVHSRGKYLKTSLQNQRKAGLLRMGEFSPENLVFKTLRREGWLDRLFKLIYSSYDKSWSME